MREQCYRGVFGTVKKKCLVRDIPLTPGVVDALQRLKTDATRPDDLVLDQRPEPRWMKKNLMNRIMKPTAKKLGMGWMGWHVLRHTHLATDRHKWGMVTTA